MSVLSMALAAVTLAPAVAASVPFESPFESPLLAEAGAAFAAGVGLPMERTLVLGAVFEPVAPIDRTLALGGAAEAFEAGLGADWAGAAACGGCCAGAGAF